MNHIAKKITCAYLMLLSRTIFIALLCIYCMPSLYAQNDTINREKVLEGVIISVNKWEQKLNEVPNKIVKVTKNQILINNPQTSADLLAQTGSVFIQKSQMGGGSPMIR